SGSNPDGLTIRQDLPTIPEDAAQGFRTGGNVEGSGLFRQVGWPKPLALELKVPPGFSMPPLAVGVMSKMMLSGCAASDRPPTGWPAGPKWSRLSRWRTRQATMWSVQEVSPLNPTPPTFLPPLASRTSPPPNTFTPPTR